MKQFKCLILSLAVCFTVIGTDAQNVSLNILTQNVGLVNQGGTVFLQVDVSNTDPAGTVAQNKVRPQISAPSSICTIAATGHSLPAGWTITSNSGSVIRITNTTDPIPPNTTRTALIAIHGDVLGGPSQITATLTFVGAAPAGENTADNISSSSIQVVIPTPVTLSDFNATLINCQPVLNWTTETETNSSKYEIERMDKNASNWISAGTVLARGNSSAKVKYNFTDNIPVVSSEKVLYRLKMIDKDGHYKYSNALPVFVNCKTSQVHVYPNPVQKGNLYISLTGLQKNTEAVLVSAAGQVVLKTILNNGTNSIDVSSIANGTYILSAGHENGISKKIKVVIQH